MATLNMLFEMPDLWQQLAEEKRDIWLYGMGNGADKILAVMAERGISVCGVFASDGFVRGHTFHGMPVRSFSELCALYPENGCVVLLSFGTARPDVLALIALVAARYPLFVPDVPVCGDTLFDAAFLTAHREEILAARALLADGNSRRIFDLALAAKLTGEFSLFEKASDPEGTDRRILALDNVRSMADFGAYNGDTAREMLSHAPLNFLLLAEPDPRNFKKLSRFAAELEGCHAVCCPVAVSDRDGSACFDASGNRNAGLCTGRESEASTVKTARPDTLLHGKTVDYIKYDVEGAEAAALCGSADVISRAMPRLKVACYHRSEDIFRLPLLLHELAPQHRLYLTRRYSLPLWDLDVLAVPPQVTE